MEEADSVYEKGLRTRKAVLGEKYVNESLQRSDEFTRPFQEFITEYCWGQIWTRPGLPHPVRSLLTLGILSALSKTNEIEAHTRGALRNGCTTEEIFEAILQATVYCGVPAGLEAMRAAQRVIAAESPAKSDGSQG